MVRMYAQYIHAINLWRETDGVRGREKTMDDGKAPKRRVGRPRKAPTCSADAEELIVTVEAALQSELHRRASKLHTKIQQARGSPKRMEVLGGSARVLVLQGETLSYAQLQLQYNDTLGDVHEMQQANAELREQVHQLYTDMAADYEHFLATIDEQSSQLRECQAPLGNTARTVEEVSPRQARRKMSKFLTDTQRALWFADTYGLTPESVQVIN